jgi:hypothetical protein
MKKLNQILTLLIALSLFLMGCGGGTSNPSNPSCAVSGYIKNQSGAGVVGVKVKATNNTNITDYYQATTNSSGKYTFNIPQAGTYTINGQGGTSGHYMVEPKTVSLILGSNNLEDILAYKLQGRGVIIQRVSGEMDSLSMKPSSAIALWKKVSLEEKVEFQNTPVYKANNVKVKAVSDSFLKDNISFILLSWENLSQTWVNHYRIYYKGPDGSLNEFVWSSADPHPEDPPADPDPQVNTAYLDLDKELDQKVTTAGTYVFRVVGLSGNESQSKELPDITVSIGMLLSNYPTGLNFTDPLLSWTKVPEANGYKIGIYNDSSLSSGVWDSGVTLLPATQSSINVPAGLTVGTYYYWNVDAHAVDSTGYTAEITRTVSGFTR